jgi:DNA mismatch repair ATPase MutS
MSINVVDNLPEGQSLLLAEIERVKELLKIAQENHAQHFFTLMVIDELFSGTIPEYGQAAGYAVAKGLGKIATNMTLISTHFVDTMKKLELDTGLFKNYMVTANVLPDKTIQYPFVIGPGVSNFNVVDAMLYNAGFNDQIMQDFYNQLNQ